MRKTRYTLLGVTTVVLVFFVAACGSQTASAPRSFTGRIENSRAFIGVTTQENRVAAYLCDGETVAEWFRGELAPDGTLDLTSAAGAQLRASLDGSSVEGMVTLTDGQTLAFTAVAAAGQAGLYRDEVEGEGVPYVAGWIVLPDGEQRGALSRAADAPTGASLGLRVLPPPPLPLDKETQERLQDFLNEDGKG